jgi:UDP-N-acetylmuramate dehydrogenase
VRIRENESLKTWTFWRIGGPADYFCLPKTIEDLKSACQLAAEKKLPITILGGGTNVLIGDAGIRGIVICMREFTSLQTEESKGRILIRASAGTPKSELTKIFLKWKLAPALFLCGIPGDVGGGIVMNAGIGEAASPREFVEIVDWVEILRDDRVLRLNKDQIHWEYRHSEGWQPGLVVGAQLSWPMDPDVLIGRKVKDATKRRIASQPHNMPSCGSKFKNPPGQKAGALIEKAGLKGVQIGGAQVSAKHANFIVNLGTASAADVRALIDRVRQTVREKFQVELETEVRFLGQ